MVRLREQSLDRAKEHLVRSGDTNIFPRPFEIEAIQHCWDELKTELRATDIMNWMCAPARTCLTPKQRYSFRSATQIDPLDCLVLTALMFELGGDIESLRIPAADRVCFSHRFSPDNQGRLYDPAIGYESFKRRTNELLQRRGTEFIVLADIADFYPRLYLHPLENCLSQTRHRNHVTALLRMIDAWNAGVSVGIPVGPRAVHLLAELCLDEIDRLLLDSGMRFCRYADDYRIVARDAADAYTHLATLANALYESYRLTLQPYKTEILSADEFRTRLVEERQGARALVAERFWEILGDYGIEYNPYEPADLTDLPAEAWERLEELDLVGQLEAQLAREEFDIPLVRSLLWKLGQLSDQQPLARILRSREHLYPVFAEVAQYLAMLELRPATERRIGTWLVSSLTQSHVGHLEYHRMWGLHASGGSTARLPARDRLVTLHRRFPDEFSRREILLLMGKAGYGTWFYNQRRNWQNLPPWERRAFLFGASSLRADQRRHYFTRVERRATLLERAVVQWASANPIG